VLPRDDTLGLLEAEGVRYVARSSRRGVNGERMVSLGLTAATDGSASTVRSRFHSQPPAMPAAMPVMTQTSEDLVTIGATSGNESAP
jgi:hypothetical protein